MTQPAAIDISEQITRLNEWISLVEREFGKRIVGNRDVLRALLRALFANGHVLMEGAPGLGKTLMVRTISEILDLKFRRVQFTPDLMPADILGTNIIVDDDRGGRHFRLERGPVFTNILLADEINRASPKTQSALLQAMEEHEATIFGKTYPLDDVFFTLATQNPIEMAGTYPLPEAQLDRFFFKLIIDYPQAGDLKEISRRHTIGGSKDKVVEKVLTREKILDIRSFLSQIPVSDRILDLAVQLIRRTHPEEKDAPDSVKRLVRYGASPRGLNSLLMAARASAVMDGRANLAEADLRENFLPALRHRLVMRFEGEIEGVGPDHVLRDTYRSLGSRL